MLQTAPVLHRTYRAPFEVDLQLTLEPLGRIPGVPNSRRDAHGAFWWATRTPLGPGTARYTQRGADVEMEAWGPGAPWLLDGLPALLGEHDTPETFRPTGKLRELHEKFSGLRILRTGALVEAALRAVCEQRVTTLDAMQSFRALCRRYGERAPGPLELWIPPDPARLAQEPYYELHPLGLELRRARTLSAVARAAHRLQEDGVSATQRMERLASIPGVGPWTQAEVAHVAHGDADAVSVGDFHLKNLVTYAFTGEPRGTDDDMLELLAPYAGHRGRVIRLIFCAGIRAPSFGPRKRRRDFRAQ